MDSGSEQVAAAATAGKCENQELEGEGAAQNCLALRSGVGAVVHPLPPGGGSVVQAGLALGARGQEQRFLACVRQCDQSPGTGVSPELGGGGVGRALRLAGVQAQTATASLP